MSHNSNPDLEPLIDSNATTTKSSVWKFGRKVKLPGLILRRRDAKTSERCGRIRLFAMLGAFAFVLIYLSNLKPYQNMIVHVPEDDKNLPGPKECNATTITSNYSINFQHQLTETTPVPPGYLVWNPQCKMVSLEPLAADVMKLFTKEDFEPCSKKKALTSVSQNFENDSVKIIFHQSLVPKYLSSDQNYIECCYQEITRGGANATADDKFNLSKCNYFDDSFDLPAPIEFILIQCKGSHSEKNWKKAKIVYSNAHAIVRRKLQVQKTFDTFRTLYPKDRPLSVLMIGIDSISRLNLIRAMPNTAQYLYDTGWFELKGYNKIDDNTFPNLMAILTGYNQSLAYSACDPKQIGKLDNCPFIWKHFEQSGYVTGYAEDEAKINTFNYHKKGFLHQPVSHYFRPFAMAAEKYLKVKLKSSLKFCLGFQHYADHIYQYALDFATVYKDDPSFGLFWANTFSHNDISDPSSMDLKIKYYLEELDSRGILNTTMVVFFSDHGLRFGPVRQLLTGWLEERLPFMFMWLPEWFKKKHPDIVQNLKVNRNRLSNPYDLHMTLKNVLELSGRIDNLPPATSCSECQSIFAELPWNRSCAETSIEQHWCTCTAYTTIDKKEKVVKEAVKYVINFINSDLDKKTKMPNSTKPLCAQLHLKSIILSKKSELINKNSSDPYTDYLLLFDVSPSNAKFESTVRHYTLGSKKKFEITGSISRLNEYGNQSYCVNTDNLKKYCFCLKRKKRSLPWNIL